MTAARGRATDARWFRQVLGQYPTGVSVVTASPGTGPKVGFVVGSFTSVSLDPPLVAFLPDKKSTSWPRIAPVGHFCINVLSINQEHVCRQFAAKAEDKFIGIRHREAPSGAPIIEDVVAWIDCDLERVEEAGDHLLVIGRVRELDVERGALPLLFLQGGYGRFSPRSLAAANRGGELTQQLRDVDLVRGEMERLCDDLAARCLATAKVGDGLVVTASAGGGYTEASATLVGQRFPFVPATGALFAAWEDPGAVEAWLAASAPALSRQHERERLAAVRARGYSVGLLNDAQRRFASTLERMAREPSVVSHEELTGLSRDLSYDPVELSSEMKNSIRVISVPVFGKGGGVAVALALYGFGDPRSKGGIDRVLGRMLEGSELATERIGGRVATPA